ncbi:RNA polymerase sigma factor [Paenibacillus psychroresistens]|uniref:RNA polymerase sigma factor n=1 Tax=Paenibacillus psychroresistens TaxID=1778678 RepID=A0A6B8RQ46_9BACL|nr:RNA polymerase sigma factor [Paenibacillus psychroresistens]QGQ97506.1 RNA polymerase sigma factor [Paenibacillus psychroresistens]
MESEYLKYIEFVDNTEMYNLMNQYGDDVWKYAYWITNNREQAKDIAQEVFIKAHYKMHTFKGQSSFKTWLLAITRNIAINEMRSSYFRRVLLIGHVIKGKPESSAEAVYIGKQSVEEIWSIIMKLSSKLREVLVLDLEHELSIREISCLLNISEGTVKSRLFRARKKVESKLKGMIE